MITSAIMMIRDENNVQRTGPVAADLEVYQQSPLTIMFASTNSGGAALQFGPNVFVYNNGCEITDHWLAMIKYLNEQGNSQNLKATRAVFAKFIGDDGSHVIATSGNVSKISATIVDLNSSDSTTAALSNFDSRAAEVLVRSSSTVGVLYKYGKSLEIIAVPALVGNCGAYSEFTDALRQVL